MERSDALHHEISKLRLMIDMQAHSLKNVESYGETDEDVNIIRAAMEKVQEKNIEHLRKLTEELRDLS